MSEDGNEPMVTQQTLASWRARLVEIRTDERQRAVALSPETGRLLEVVGQALAQGTASLPSEEISRLEELTKVEASYN